jgi:hypothetical protein
VRRVLAVIAGLVVVAAAGVLAFAATDSGEVVQLPPAQAAAALPVLVAAAEQDEWLIGTPNTFCNVDVVGYSELPDDGTEAQAYTTVSCMELIPGKDGDLTVGEGMESAVRFTVRGVPSDLKVVKVDVPDDIGYSDSVDELFPSGPARDAAYGVPSFDDCALLNAARQRHDLPRATVGGDPALSESFADCT